MSDYFIGGIGKEYSYKLVSKERFIVFSEIQPSFVGYGNISDALHYLDSADHTVYAFSDYTGNWEEIHFAAEGLGSTAPPIGFKPS